MDLEWTETERWRGVLSYRRSDGAMVRPTITAGGNVKYEAQHPTGGAATSDRGYPTKFGTAKAAKRWIAQMDERKAQTLSAHMGNG